MTLKYLNSIFPSKRSHSVKGKVVQRLRLNEPLMISSKTGYMVKLGLLSHRRSVEVIWYDGVIILVDFSAEQFSVETMAR